VGQDSEKRAPGEEVVGKKIGDIGTFGNSYHRLRRTTVADRCEKKGQRKDVIITVTTKKGVGIKLLSDTHS